MSVFSKPVSKFSKKEHYPEWADMILARLNDIEDKLVEIEEKIDKLMVPEDQELKEEIKQVKLDAKTNHKFVQDLVIKLIDKPPVTVEKFTPSPSSSNGSVAAYLARKNAEPIKKLPG